MSDVFSRFADLLAVGPLSRIGVSKSSRFIHDLGFDSVDLCELALDCEDEFRIDVPVAELEKFVTVGDAVNFIEASLALHTLA